MTFGEWIRWLRKERNLNIRTLAAQSGVETSTISRVENDQTQVTLLIAIRLCEGLGASVSDILSEVYGISTLKRSQEERNNRSAAPTMSDVEQFLHYFRHHQDEARDWLIGLLNKISFLFESAERTHRPFLSRFFGPEDIQKLLFDSAMYRFELQYPSNITKDDILYLYDQGAMLTLTDIVEFLQKLRREKQVTIAKLEREAKISQNMLSRLESSFIEQIKLADVVMLDEQLDQRGTLLKMYWSVYSFYLKLVRRSAASADQEMRLAAIFIIICRWLQFEYSKDDSWMKYVRSFERLA